jgi:F-type H+-transporting ATPase subunit epsilon
MADQLRLRIYTPERQVADLEVQAVTAPATLGEIGVLPDHAALVTSIDPGTLSYTSGGSRVVLQVGAGFAEVRDNVMTVLTDSAKEQ